LWSLYYDDRLAVLKLRSLEYHRIFNDLVCGIPKYGSESEFKKPNRTVPNYFSNSEKDGIPTFSEFRHLLCETDYLASSDDWREARKLPTNCGAVCLLLIRRVELQDCTECAECFTYRLEYYGLHCRLTFFLIEQQAICGTKATDCQDRIEYHATRPPNVPSSKYQIRNEMFFLSVY